MSSNTIKRLLIAAMERHISWRDDSSELPKEWASFDLEVDVPYEPPFGSIGDGWEAPLEEADRPDLVIPRGRYQIPADRYIDEDRNREGVIRYNNVFHYHGIRKDRDGVSLIATYVPTMFAVALNGNRATVRAISFTDLLALIAINDAKAAGRDDDAELCRGIVYRGFHDGLGEKDGEEIFSHIGEKKPSVTRSGNPIWGPMMGADSRHNSYESDGSIFDKGVIFTVAGASNNVTIYQGDKDKPLVVDAGTEKLLYQINEIITRDDLHGETPNEVVSVVTSYEEILSGRDLEVTRGNKERVRKQVEQLHNHRVRVSVEDGDHDVEIVSSTFVGRGRNGRIIVNVTPEFIALAMGYDSGLIPNDPALLATDDKRYPHAWSIGNRLRQHTYMNYSDDFSHRLSVAKLLDYVKAIPTYEDIKEAGRNYTQKIIEPMERTLNYLVEYGYLSDWDYCHAKGEPLTDEEQAARLDDAGNEKAMPYDIAKGLLITWEFVNEYEGHMQAVEDARALKKAKERGHHRAGSRRL